MNEKAFELLPCTEEDAAFIGGRLDEEDFAAIPKARDEELLVFKAVDRNGDMIGGCVLDIDCWGLAEFNSLWVHEDFRRRGVGSCLVRAAERAAGERGCRSVSNAYCFDFQNAAPLFRKLGYELAGEIKNWPPGHEGFMLIKRLAAADAGEPPYPVLPGSEAEGEYVDSRLKMHNAAIAPRSHGYLDIMLKLADENGNTAAGCIAGASGWDALHIDALWVDEKLRGRGMGSRLLEAAEREAKEKAAVTAIANALDGQRAFFEKRGYHVCGRFDDFPEGHSLYTMQKML